MVGLAAKRDIVQQLQKEVISLQGRKRSQEEEEIAFGLGPIERAFPGHRFPTGVVHEFVSHAAGHSAATNGFIAGLLSSLMSQQGPCIWVSTQRDIFPPALRSFHVDPERIIFIDAGKQKEALWTIEEALKCSSLSAVVGELGDLGFKESRRLQLAVEQSAVTGLIHRRSPRHLNTVACVSRWQVSSLPGVVEDGLPGVGFPKWQVQLLKVRNGKPGTWQMQWSDEGFRYLHRRVFSIPGIQPAKTGSYA